MLWNDISEPSSTKAAKLEAIEAELTTSLINGEGARPPKPPTTVREAINHLAACLSVVATEEDARPFADLILRLMDEPDFYELASTTARSSGLEFIRTQRGRFGRMVEDLWREYATVDPEVQ